MHLETMKPRMWVVFVMSLVLFCLYYEYRHSVILAVAIGSLVAFLRIFAYIQLGK